MTPRIHLELEAALFVTRRAPTVWTLERFEALLQVIQDSPKSLRGEMLAALGTRVNFLHPREQQDGINTLLALLVKAQSHHEVLAEFITKVAAPRAGTLTDFNNLLLRIVTLPTPLHKRSLEELGRQISCLPSEVQQQASSAFCASAGFFASTKNYPDPELRAAFIATAYAPTVSMRTDFDALLKMTGDLSKPSQVKLLATLGARIHYLPTTEQQDAIDAFLRIAQGIPEPRPALLNELIQAADGGPQGLAAREGNALGPAKAAIRADENVQAIAQRYGITLRAFIAVLEDLSLHGPAGEAVRKGAPVSDTAEKYGIVSPRLIKVLETISINRLAGKEVRKGASVLDIAEKYGITGRQGIDTLESISFNGPAGEAVKKGASVSETAKKYGITNPHRIIDLEMISIKRPAGEAVRNGASVADTAKKYGITSAESIAILESFFAKNRTERP